MEFLSVDSAASAEPIAESRAAGAASGTCSAPEVKLNSRKAPPGLALGGDYDSRRHLPKKYLEAYTFGGLSLPSTGCILVRTVCSVMPMFMFCVLSASNYITVPASSQDYCTLVMRTPLQLYIQARAH